MAADKKQSLKGPDSRDRLLEAAIDVFGKQGFHAATTRMIAAEAGANIAAIPYYFNGKTGLYHAVVEHIADTIESRVKESEQGIRARVAAGNLDSQEAVDLLEKLLGVMIDFMVGSREALRFARIILREQFDPSPAYDIIFSRVMAPMIHAMAAMVAIATGEPPSRVASLRALAIMGQVFAFRVARETAVRALDMEGYSPEEIAEIRRVILEQTRAAMLGITRSKRKA